MKVTTNRKRTNGRRIYYQQIAANTVEKEETVEKDGKEEVEIYTVDHPAKTVKHIQVSPHKLKVGYAMLDAMERSNKALKNRPELSKEEQAKYDKTLKKKREKNREVLVHNSIMKGTLVNENKLYRNDKCKCGSEKKYKKCCLNKPEDDKKDTKKSS
jgi:hypothetical protein